MTGTGARRRILAGVREALEGRPSHPHPGGFSRGDGTLPDPVHTFQEVFQAAGGEVVHLRDEAEARTWLAEFGRAFTSVTTGTGVPAGLTPGLSPAPPAHADWGISVARGGVAETGSLILGAEDGRRTQLLPPTHVVLLNAKSIYPTLREALMDLQEDLPSGLGLHSGPSKSADIGQILVKGVHGPGRVVAVVMAS